MSEWQPMETAPRNALVDLKFDHGRETDCQWEPSLNSWAKREGYPVSWRVFLKQPTGWRYAD